MSVGLFFDGEVFLFTRATGILIVPIWLTAMGWLVAHDVWPSLDARDPPRVLASEWLQGGGQRAQFAVHSYDERIGTIWTRYDIDRQSIQRRDTLFLDRFALPIAPFRVVADSTFTADGLIDEFTVQLDKHGMRSVKIHGERFHADFSFVIEQGPSKRAFKLPLSGGGIIGSGLNPFASLTDLEIGRTWHMQVFNPLSALTGLGNRFSSVLVEVTGQETIIAMGEEVCCFVVECSGTKAWVDERGAVMMQEVFLPLGGAIRIVREATYDENALAEVRRTRFEQP